MMWRVLHENTLGLTQRAQELPPATVPVHVAQVSGEVLQRDGKAVRGVKLAGKWDEELRATMPAGSERLLWRVSPPAAED